VIVVAEIGSFLLYINEARVHLILIIIIIEKEEEPQMNER
jgi:hypothetical protein